MAETNCLKPRLKPVTTAPPPTRPSDAELSAYVKGIDNLEKSVIVDVKNTGLLTEIKMIPWGQYLGWGEVQITIRDGLAVLVRVDQTVKI